MKRATRRIRILHIVGGMGRGGVETWLMHVLRHADRERFQMDFLVHTAQPCPYDEEVRALGGNIIPCLDPARPWSYARNFRRALAAQGRYDIVHSHVHNYSGYVLRLARRAGVPVRIAHSHLDSTPGDAAANARRRLYLALARRWIRRHATTGLAASGKAADALFGPAWRREVNNAEATHAQEDTIRLPGAFLIRSPVMEAGERVFFERCGKPAFSYLSDNSAHV